MNKKEIIECGLIALKNMRFEDHVLEEFKDEMDCILDGIEE